MQYGFRPYCCASLARAHTHTHMLTHMHTIIVCVNFFPGIHILWHPTLQGGMSWTGSAKCGGL